LRKKEYDFLTWTSFPSSAKLTNDEGGDWAWWGWIFTNLAVTPGAKLLVKFKAKQQDVLYSVSHIPVDGYNGKEWRRLWSVSVPLGTLGWSEYSAEITVPSDVIAIRSSPAGGAGSKEKPGVTWFDDVEVYLDGKLIFKEGFSNWNPYLGAVAGAAVGGAGGYLVTRKPEYALIALPAAVIGGLVGWLTASP